MKKRDLIRSLNDRIREGNTAAVQKSLKELHKKKIDRELVVPVASLARRSNFSFLAIRLLNPIVRPSPKTPMQASDSEKAEYAANLLRIGAYQESKKLLESVDTEKVPEGLLFRAFALFSTWDYAGAIPLLMQYCENPRLSDYARCVGRVNLAAALVNQVGDTRTVGTLGQLMEETRRKGFLRLYGNTLELMGQFSIFQKKFSRADNYLNQARSVLQKTGGLDSFFVKKWKAIAEAMQAGNLSKLKTVKKEARALMHWETLRECDLFEGVAVKNEALLSHLFFGTSFESFRSRIFLHYGSPLELPSSYNLTLGGRARTEFDLETGSVGKKRVLKVGQSSHRLLSILATDFYRPFHLATLHALLFPDEFYNPVSAPNRIHQAIKRLKERLAQCDVPLDIGRNRSLYYLSSNRSVTLRIQRKDPARDPYDSLFRVLKEHGPGEYSRAEVEKLLTLPSRSTSRFLLWALRKSKIQRYGRGPQTRYRLG